MSPNQSDMLAAVTEWVVERCPDVMELKFGCLLKPRAGECIFMVLAQTKDHVQVLNTFAMEYEHIGPDGNPIQWVWKDKGANKKIVTFSERFTILGRPILLDDIMRSLPQAECYFVSNRGWFFEMQNRELHALSVHWTHGKGLAWHAENAPELIAFLFQFTKRG